MAEIIAEIGINHQGKPEMAKSLIFQAFQSGISRVKFQYRNDVRGLPAGKEIGDEILNAELKKNHMSVNHLQDLVDYSKQLGLETGISFFSLEDLLKSTIARMLSLLKRFCACSLENPLNAREKTSSDKPAPV